MPEADEFSGVELVYEVEEAARPPRAPPGPADVVVVPRYVVYFQGALLAIVALVAFAIGMLMGGTFVSRPSAADEAIVVSGSVTFMSGPRSRADEGAVVMLLPELRGKADEKAPIAGLRPSDPEPGDDAKGLVILRQIGGAYARADENGRWETEVPRRGRYVLLVISKEQKRPRSEGEVRMADLRKLSAYFESGAALIGDRRYVLRMELMRDEQAFAVEFD